MYAYIKNKNTIELITEKEFNVNDIHFEIMCEDNKLTYNDMKNIKRYIQGKFYNKTTFTLEKNIDITKIYTINYGKKKIEVDIKQYYKTEEFEKLYCYDGKDLGLKITGSDAIFKVWSPVATSIKLKLFKDDKTEKFESFEMKKQDKGIYVYNLELAHKYRYYTFEVECFGKVNEAVDIYARGVGTNGERAMIVNLENTNPAGFRSHSFENTKSITDAIIYEIHVRDLSMSENSGIKNKGKFLGFTEHNTVNSFNQSTGLSHIVELGATHVHLLPSFDYKSIDESDLDKNDFNWGYDPQNYNTPEGSYSTNPEDGHTRIREMKAAIFAMHDAGLGVIMDVVYNHTYDTKISNHEKFVPGYYYRCDEFGKLTDGSACSNETASERYMVRKHFIESLVYWAKEYKIDGFRFDLMGLHDVDTMNEIRDALDNVRPNIIIYGEGWCGGPTPLPEDKRALKKNAPLTDYRVAYFSDDVRDGVKGDVFVDETPGFVNGGLESLEDVKFGIVGSVKHKQVNIEDVKYSDEFWACEPTQTVTYVSAHDNLTLFDKFIKTCPDASEEELVKMNKLACFITHISQGALFFQAGEEFARTKNGDENSYKSPDSVNQIDWDRKKEYKDLFDFYKGMIELRKSDEVFRLDKTAKVNKKVSFGECNEQFLTVKYKTSSKDYSEYTAFVNASDNPKVCKLDSNSEYIVLVDGEVAGVEPLDLVVGEITIPPKTAVLIAKPNKKPSEKILSFIKENKKCIAIAGGSVLTGLITSKIIKKIKK